MGCCWGGGSGTVTTVSGTAPISVATPTTTPVISIAPATITTAGSLSAADKVKIDALPATIVSSVTGTAPIAVATGTTTPAISANLATASDAATGTSATVLMTPQFAVPKDTSGMAGAAILPSGPNYAPTGTGYFRYNTTSNHVEYYDGSAYQTMVNRSGDTMSGNLFISQNIAGFSAIRISNTNTTAPSLSSLQLDINGNIWDLTQQSPAAANRPSWLTFGLNGVTQAGFTPQGALRVGINDDFQNVGNLYSTSTGAVPCFTIRNSAAASTKAWSINADPTNSITVLNNGNTGVFMADGATSWSAFSDENLKDITGGFDSALEDVKSLRAVRFTWKSDEERKSQVGVIAQDVQKVLPEAVSNGPDGYLGVAYTNLIPLMVAALQESAAKIEHLESELAALKSN